MPLRHLHHPNKDPAEIPTRMKAVAGESQTDGTVSFLQPILMHEEEERGLIVQWAEVEVESSLQKKERTRPQM
jgi:hypothetical protein